MYFLMVPQKCAHTGLNIHIRRGVPMKKEITAQKAVKRFPGAYAVDEHNRMVLQNIRADMPARV